MKNKVRRQKLADLLFDTVKYVLTIGIIRAIISKEFRIFEGILWLVFCILAIIGAYFLTPLDEMKEKE